MKHYLIGAGLAAVLSAGPVVAADMQVKAPVYKAQPAIVTYNWTSCYLGANVGYASANESWVEKTTSSRDFGNFEGSNSFNGGVVGGQIGCDYKLDGAWVVGIQGMYNWADLNESHPYIDDTRFTDGSKISSLATLTGRIGYLVRPQALLYIKGGAAWVRNTFTDTCAAPSVDGYVCPGVAKVTRSGWTLGGGLEYMLERNWSIYAEFNYMDFGRNIESLVYSSAPYGYNPEIKQSVQAIQVGLNYRFNIANTSVVSKY